MMIAAARHFARPSLAVLTVMAASAVLLASIPAGAQSMLGAPGLSPVAPGALSPAPQSVQPPPALTAPPASTPESSCQTDVEKFQTRRQAQIDALNKLVAAGKGKIDPITSCPKLRSLVTVEGEMRAWMIKQKDWCNIPDEVIEQMKEGTGKTAQMADRACEAAAQMRRQQQQPAGGLGTPPAMKLPSGPL